MFFCHLLLPHLPTPKALESLRFYLVVKLTSRLKLKIFHQYFKKY